MWEKSFCCSDLVNCLRQDGAKFYEGFWFGAKSTKILLVALLIAKRNSNVYSHCNRVVCFPWGVKRVLESAIYIWWWMVNLKFESNHLTLDELISHGFYPLKSERAIIMSNQNEQQFKSPRVSGAYFVDAGPRHQGELLNGGGVIFSKFSGYFCPRPKHGCDPIAHATFLEVNCTLVRVCCVILVWPGEMSLEQVGMKAQGLAVEALLHHGPPSVESLESMLFDINDQLADNGRQWVTCRTVNVCCATNLSAFCAKEGDLKQTACFNKRSEWAKQVLWQKDILIFSLESCLKDLLKMTNDLTGNVKDNFTNPIEAVDCLSQGHLLDKSSCYDPDPEAITLMLKHVVRDKFNGVPCSVPWHMFTNTSHMFYNIWTDHNVGRAARLWGDPASECVEVVVRRGVVAPFPNSGSVTLVRAFHQYGRRWLWTRECELCRDSRFCLNTRELRGFCSCVPCPRWSTARGKLSLVSSLVTRNERGFPPPEPCTWIERLISGFHMLFVQRGKPWALACFWNYAIGSTSCVHTCQKRTTPPAQISSPCHIVRISNLRKGSQSDFRKVLFHVCFTHKLFFLLFTPIFDLLQTHTDDRPLCNRSCKPKIGRPTLSEFRVVSASWKRAGFRQDGFPPTPDFAVFRRSGSGVAVLLFLQVVEKHWNDICQRFRKYLLERLMKLPSGQPSHKINFNGSKRLEYVQSLCALNPEEETWQRYRSLRGKQVNNCLKESSVSGDNQSFLDVATGFKAASQKILIMISEDVELFSSRVFSHTTSLFKALQEVYMDRLQEEIATIVDCLQDEIVQHKKSEKTSQQHKDIPKSTSEFVRLGGLKGNLRRQHSKSLDSLYDKNGEAVFTDLQGILPGEQLKVRNKKKIQLRFNLIRPYLSRP